MSPEPTPNKNFKWPLLVAAIFLTVALMLTATVFAFQYRFRDRIYPRISIGNVPIGGLTPTSAVKLITEKADSFSQKGLVFSYAGKSVVFLPIVSSLGSDMAYQLVSFDIETSIRRAKETGRISAFDKYFFFKILDIFKSKYLELSYTINENEVKRFLDANFSEFSQPAKNASLEYEKIGSSTIIFKVKKEEYGQILDLDRAFKELKQKLGRLDGSPIGISLIPSMPQILEKDCLNIEASAEKILGRFPLLITHSDKEWTIEKERGLGWLTLKKENGLVSVGLNRELIAEYLNKELAPSINIEPIDAKFEIKDGKVSEFRVATNGLMLDAQSSAAQIENGLHASGTAEIALVIEIKKSALDAEKVSSFGIKEIIGTGKSNFSGSPKNRRHNIAVGAAAVNGTLIAPQEEFSLIKTLGKIDKSSGYLPELVIKDNKTTPEYGGGLCQIGTTVFRGTVAAGLPVTERRNHSYRVSYYEPAGTDATIYDPWPDYRFKNDTQNHILIQSRFEGDMLFFDFWGTADGRIATHTYPRIYNIVKPGPTKIIETADLKPGEKKCTEHAHNGADAFFDYAVIYSKNNPPEAIKQKMEKGEEVKDEDYTQKERFKSHYVPWREVCLVGIDKEAVKTASSTAEKTEPKSSLEKN